MNISTFTR